MDICRPVMSSALELACPHCDHVDEDPFECIEDNCLQPLHCVECGQTGHFAVMECPDCAAEHLFTWQSRPAPEDFLILQCGRCNRRYQDHETTSA